MTSQSGWVARLGATVLALGLATMARAGLITPTGLGPGDTYQLAFVTAGTTSATSADIATYNAFVQSAANAAGMGSISWHAIASTMTVSASSNAVVSARVYNMNGELVATGFTDFWDGTHANGLDYNEANVGRNTNVWTGTLGSGASGGAGDALGEATPLWGESTLVSVAWTAHAGNTSSTAYSLYALSEVITVLPEPAALTVLGVMVLGALPRRRRR